MTTAQRWEGEAPAEPRLASDVSHERVWGRPLWESLSKASDDAGSLDKVSDKGGIRYF